MVTGNGKGEPVKVRYNIPIFFRMPDEWVAPKPKLELVFPVGQEVKIQRWRECGSHVR